MVVHGECSEESGSGLLKPCRGSAGLQQSDNGIAAPLCEGIIFPTMMMESGTLE